MSAGIPKSTVSPGGLRSALMPMWLLCVCSSLQAAVTLSEAEFSGQSHFKITTPSASYWLEKSGAGLARMLDRDGNDWLSFRPTPGSGAGGEYRGFPNAVHQQAGNYFHARNQATEPCTLNVDRTGPERVTISAVSSNGLWAGRYDFFPMHCTFTMTKMPADKKYWVLYEGTPGGSFDDTDWWMTSAVTTPQLMSTQHHGDIPAPEWMAFGDVKISRVIFLLHHEDDAHPDRFYQMNRQMTVFGFGRQGINKFLDRVPQSFSIGFLETTNHGDMREQLEAIHRQGNGGKGMKTDSLE